MEALRKLSWTLLKGMTLSLSEERVMVWRLKLLVASVVILSMWAVMMVILSRLSVMP